VRFLTARLNSQRLLGCGYRVAHLIQANVQVGQRGRNVSGARVQGHRASIRRHGPIGVVVVLEATREQKLFVCFSDAIG
jgi:hypothetical protein